MGIKIGELQACDRDVVVQTSDWEGGAADGINANGINKLAASDKGKEGDDGEWDEGHNLARHIGASHGVNWVVKFFPFLASFSPSGNWEWMKIEEWINEENPPRTLFKWVESILIQFF